MPTLTSLAASVCQLLNDPLEKRFSVDLLTCAIRQALQTFDLHLPQTLVATVTVAAAGRSQTLSGITGCLFLVSLITPAAASRSRLEPETHFSYRVTAGVPTLYFHGEFIPQAGDVLEVHYAAVNTIEGLDNAAATTLPAISEPAFTAGAAACACSLRAASLTESHGVRPEDAARLLETSLTWQQRFEHLLTGLKILQEFGYPPGFALDAWDRG